jgi:predicted alpha/beta hydrolase
LIELHLFEPYSRGEPLDVAILNSGAGIPKRFYSPFAAWLADNDVPTLTYDYRGIGGSREASIRGVNASIEDWGSKDCAGAIGWLHRRYPRARIHVVGHSIGSVVTGFVSNSPQIERMLLVSPHTGYWAEYAKSARLRMFLAWNISMPFAASVFGYFPGRILGLPEDLPYRVAMQWARWGSSRRTSASSEVDVRHPESFRQFRMPVLAIRPADDVFATSDALRTVKDLFSNCQFSEWFVGRSDGVSEKLGHFAFFRSRNRRALWQPTLDWIKRGELTWDAHR